MEVNLQPSTLQVAEFFSLFTWKCFQHQLSWLRPINYRQLHTQSLNKRLKKNGALCSYAAFARRNACTTNVNASHQVCQEERSCTDSWDFLQLVPSLLKKGLTELGSSTNTYNFSLHKSSNFALHSHMQRLCTIPWLARRH